MNPLKSPKLICEGALIFLTVFLLIELYYSGKSVLPWEIIATIAGVTIVGVIYFFEHFFSDRFSAYNTTIFEIIIIILCIFMVATPIVLHCCFPNDESSQFKKSCYNIKYSELNNSLSNWEGKKVSFTCKILDAKPQGGSWLIIANINGETNNTVAVFYNGNLPNDDSIIKIYGIVYGFREFKETNTQHPGIFAFYIEPVKNEGV